MKICILGVALLFYALPALAETYSWEDDQGTVSFTEDIGNVPAKYRKRVKIVGEDDSPPPEEKVLEVKPPVQGKSKSPAAVKDGAPSARQDKSRAVYGGKEGAAWKAEISALDADVKGAEKQLVELRSSLQDSSTMSRSDYLSIQATVRSLENSVMMRREKLDQLKREAVEAGVPAELME